MEQPPTQWPHAYSQEEFCAIHGYEPIPDGEIPYRICGECLHAFMTAEELVDKDAAMHREVFGVLRRSRPEEIYSCPECTHDF